MDISRLFFFTVLTYVNFLLATSSTNSIEENQLSAVLNDYNKSTPKQSRFEGDRKVERSTKIWGCHGCIVGVVRVAQRAWRRGLRLPALTRLSCVCCRTTQPAPHLDNVHVVFGRVVGGAALVRQLEAAPVDRHARPLQDITVINCGQLVKLKSGKKRKTDKEHQESGAESDEEHSHRHDKKKKKEKKEKKKKRHQSEASGEEADPEAEIPPHPLAVTSKIDPREIPDVPANKFLMRGGRDQDKSDRQDPRRERDRMRYRERERHAYTRSGRIIKGRGVFRYRTPSRSRSRSRSVTPPHWRQAQRRMIKLSEIERVEQDKLVKEPSAPIFQPKVEEKKPNNANEGGTPEMPREKEEKEEGECDTTMEQSHHEKVDYNALDFEAEVENEDEYHGNKERRRGSGSRRRARSPPAAAAAPAPPRDNKSDMLALALGVNPKHDDLPPRSPPRRREGLVSTIGSYSGPRLASAVGLGGDTGARGRGPDSSGRGDDYDPFILLRSTFNREKPKDFKGKEYRKEDRPERYDNRREREKEDRRDRQRDEKHRDERERDREDKRDKLKDERDREQRREKYAADREEKKDKYRDDEKDRRDRYKNEKKENDRKEESRPKRMEVKYDRERLYDREKNDLMTAKQAETGREDRRREEKTPKKQDGREERKKSTKSRERTKSPAPQGTSARAPNERQYTPDRPADTSQAKQDKERQEARKELMEIVRLIKSRQRDRERNAALADIPSIKEKKKKRAKSSSGSSRSRSRSRSRKRRGKSEGSKSRGRRRRSRARNSSSDSSD
ncbi:Peptidyl-prolyl cis-trans isomerase 1 [Eumeta japonica]|uniref:Peptidyl-prolyl cis-trans isomerase 1 n=1 Tax=Eumeta variegata TaxID=151549 RepID=A0A4C1Y1F2_EUMVA|nr:Peptidyl-prolyl cis-trans isomerase 1 [Eumeta japonica]